MPSTTRSKQQGSNKGQQNQPPMAQRVEATLSRLEKKDPGLRDFLRKAYGYAVFPSVGKASLVIGGAHGRGAVFERGKLIGYATLSQLTLGVQIGGETFTEILAFHDKESLDRFKSGQMAFTANAAAVLVKAGAAGTSNFKGVTAHAYSSGGMLLELAIGGQKFSFKPVGGKQDEKSKNGGKQGKSEQRGQEEKGEEGDDESEGGGLGQMLDRARSAVGGVRDAASKVGDFAKEHPIAATLVGAGVTTGLTFMIVRAIRQAQSASGSDEQQDEQDEQDDYEDDEDTNASDQNDEGDEGEDRGDDDEGEEEDEHPALTRRGRARA